MNFNANRLYMLTKSCLLTVVVIILSFQGIDWASGVERTLSGNGDKVPKTVAQNEPESNPLSIEIESDPDQVKVIQERLNELVYNAGEIDGKLGPKFKRALIAFQKMNGLN